MWFSPLTLRHLVGVAVSAAVVSPALATINDKDFAPDDIIIRDVCVLGGGATGAYAAVRLKDKAQSVVVVERNDILGGHTETLYVGDDYVDYGVEGVFNTELSRDFFDRLGIDHKPLLPDTLSDKTVNFKTGKKVDPPAGLLDTVGAALLYRGAIQKYHYFDEGVYNISSPVPDELLRPFREFVEKEHIQRALPLIFMFAHTAGNLLDTPLLYVLQLFGKPHLDAFLEGGYITPKNGMYQLYEGAAQVLGSDVLYQSTVDETERSGSGVKLVVRGSNGSRKLIKAKKLLITFAPTPDNLNGFDLSKNESSLFQKWTWNTYYVGVVNNTGLPDSTTVTNVDPATGPGGLPKVPFQWALQYLGAPGHLATKIVADKDFSPEQAKTLILDDIRRMGTAGTYSVKDPEIVAFGSHAPEGLTVSNDEIRNGFYQKLYDLQGNDKNTYYTGLAWCSDYTALLWAYTDTVIKQMVSA